MNGLNFITFLNYPDEKYSLSMPNFYARGILFGKMYVELGDKISISCPKNDLNCDIEFKTKVLYKFLILQRDISLVVIILLKEKSILQRKICIEYMENGLILFI